MSETGDCVSDILRASDPENKSCSSVLDGLEALHNQSQSQCETCIAPLTKLDSGAEQNNILKHTIKIKKKKL